MKTNDFVSHQLFLSLFPAPNMNKVTCHTLWLKQINSHINNTSFKVKNKLYTPTMPAQGPRPVFLSLRNQI